MRWAWRLGGVMVAAAAVALGAWTHSWATAQDAVGTVAAVPVGSVIADVRVGDPPAGYLPADGRAVSRTTYPRLFAVVCPAAPSGASAAGTANCPFGTPDGATFTLPDLRSRTAIGTGQGTASGAISRAVGTTVGADTVTLTGAQSGAGAHDHPASQAPHDHNLSPATSGTMNSNWNHSHGHLDWYWSECCGGSYYGSNFGYDWDNSLFTYGNTTGSAGWYHLHQINFTSTSVTPSVTTANPATTPPAAAAHSVVQPYLAQRYLIKADQ